MTRVEPNPYSPYATASPGERHLFPVPFWFPAVPRPSALTPTGCGELAVVPEAPVKIQPGEPLPEGVCGGCAASLADDTVTQAGGPLTDCRECGLRTQHDGLCALCRQQLHDVWWLSQAARGGADV